MRIAICFSGMIRSGIRAAPNILNFIGDLRDNVDFFMHTWDEDFRGPFVGETWPMWELGVSVLGKQLDKNKLKEFVNLYKFKNYAVENNHVIMGEMINLYGNISFTNTDWWIPLFYSWAASINLKKLHEREHGFKYDYVVKLRPDILFRNNIKLANLIEKVGDGSFGINHITGGLQADDILFISNSDIMDIASKFYIDRIILEGHLSDIESHLAFYFYITKSGLNPRDIGLGYLGEQDSVSLLRNESPNFDVITEYYKIMEVDKILYHSLSVRDTKHLCADNIGDLCNKVELLNGSLPPSLTVWKNENSNLF